MNSGLEGPLSAINRHTIGELVCPKAVVRLLPHDFAQMFQGFESNRRNRLRACFDFFTSQMAPRRHVRLSMSRVIETIAGAERLPSSRVFSSTIKPSVAAFPAVLSRGRNIAHWNLQRIGDTCAIR